MQSPFASPRNLEQALRRGLLVSSLLFAPLSALHATPAPPTGAVATAAAQEQRAPLRYVRVSAPSARLLNLADDKGMSVAEPPRGTLLAVFDEGVNGWQAVEMPGGFPVWVFGRYLESTEEEGVFRVTRNAVNIRPGPSSDVAHFPLAQRLHAGDRVRVLETLDPTAPLSETWARILSPPGVRAWMKGADTTALAAGEDGATLWLESLAQTQSITRPAQPVPTSVAGAAATEGGGANAEAPVDALREQLDQAHEMLRLAKESETPDYPSVRLALEAVISAAPNGPTAVEARHTLESIDTLEEAARLRAELLQERERRARLALEEQRAVWEASKRKDPFGGVFLVRGVLSRRSGSDDQARYFLRFDGDTVCELMCSTGRYELERFTGFYVGVQGAEVLAPDGGPGAGPAIPPVEVSRLEILSRR